MAASIKESHRLTSRIDYLNGRHDAGNARHYRVRGEYATGLVPGKGGRQCRK
jgi:hypothetical protein